MRSNGNHYPMGPPDHTAILIDLLQETRQQSHQLGWIAGSLQAVRSDQVEIKGRVSALEAKPSAKEDQSRHRFRDWASSMSELMREGRPYLIVVALVLGKFLGLGPSWIEPLAERIINAL